MRISKGTMKTGFLAAVLFTLFFFVFSNPKQDIQPNCKILNEYTKNCDIGNDTHIATIYSKPMFPNTIFLKDGDPITTIKANDISAQSYQGNMGVRLMNLTHTSYANVLFYTWTAFTSAQNTSIGASDDNRVSAYGSYLYKFILPTYTSINWINMTVEGQGNGYIWYLPWNYSATPNNKYYLACTGGLGSSSDSTSTCNITSGFSNVVQNNIFYFGYNCTSGDSSYSIDFTKIDVSYNTDTTAPFIIISSPTNTTYVQNWVWANVTLNEAGSWCGVNINGTNQTMANSTGNYNFNMTSLADGTHQARFFCNDTSGNMNDTVSNVTFTTDMTAPTYSSNSTNSTLAGTPISHNLNWTDDIGLSGYIFSFNSSGSWKNSTWVSFNGGTWSNVTNITNSTSGLLIRWCFYANDTSNNWNGTSCVNPFSYVTTSSFTPKSDNWNLTDSSANIDSSANFKEKSNTYQDTGTLSDNFPRYNEKINFLSNFFSSIESQPFFREIKKALSDISSNIENSPYFRELFRTFSDFFTANGNPQKTSEKSNSLTNLFSSSENISSYKERSNSLSDFLSSFALQSTYKEAYKQISDSMTVYAVTSGYNELKRMASDFGQVFDNLIFKREKSNQLADKSTGTDINAKFSEKSNSLTAGSTSSDLASIFRERLNSLTEYFSSSGNPNIYKEIQNQVSDSMTVYILTNGYGELKRIVSDFTYAMENLNFAPSERTQTQTDSIASSDTNNYYRERLNSLLANTVGFDFTAPFREKVFAISTFTFSTDFIQTITQQIFKDITNYLSDITHTQDFVQPLVESLNQMSEQHISRDIANSFREMFSILSNYIVSGDSSNFAREMSNQVSDSMTAYFFSGAFREKSNWLTDITAYFENLEVWLTCQIGVNCPTGTIVITTGGGGGSLMGVPYAFTISDITIHSINYGQANISFMMSNKGYINPIQVNVSQRLVKTATFFYPTETLIYENTSIILVSYLQPVNTTFKWFGDLPDGVYRIDVRGISTNDPRASSIASMLFNYTAPNFTSGNQTIFAIAPAPSISDIVNDPNVRVVCYGIGIVGIGVISLVLVREWVFKKRRKTATQ